MKKRQKRLASLLLAGMMLCVPTAQAMAETTYEASAGVSGQLLFPEDSLANVPLAVAVDGQEAALEEGGIWKNTDKDKVYSAESDETGVIQLTQEGYVLVVEGGVSEKNNVEDETPDHHYQFREEEKPETTKDIACYDKDETVKLKADDPEEGMVFTGWTSDTEGVTFADPAAAETTIVMLDKKVEVKATYGPAPVETEAPVETDAPAEDGAQDPAAGDTVDPNAGDTGSGEGTDIVIDTVVVDGDGVIEVDTPAEEPAAPAQYNLYINDGTGTGSYAAGSQVTVTANDYTADGYQFSGWRVDYENVTLDDPTAEIATFTMPEEEVVLSAQYTEIPQEPVVHTVTVNDGILENGTNTGTYDAESWVIVTANDRTAEGLEFNGWFVDSMNAGVEDAAAVATGFVMPDADVTISAQYKTIETEAPTTEAPTTEAPVTEAPTTEAPAAEEPVTEAPTTEAPAVEAPVTEAPTTEAPTTEAPVTEAPAAEDTTEETDPIQIETSAPEQTEAAAEVVQTEAPVQTFEVVVENGLGSGEYAAGSTVTVEAVTEEGQVFEGWQTDNASVTIADPTQEVVTFTMPEEGVTVTAEYAEGPDTTITYKLNAEKATADSDTYAAGATVTVTATDLSTSGFVVSGWTATLTDANGTVIGDLSNLSDVTVDNEKGTITFAMPSSNVSIIPVYEQSPNYYKITISNGLINGTVTEVYLAKDSTFSIAPGAAPYGQEFEKWIINDGAYDLGDSAATANLTLTATENMTILADFDGIEYEVSVADGYSDYDECVVGTVVTITADEAPEGYEFDYWYVDTENVSLTDAYSETTTFTMPDGAVSVTANYKQVEFLVTVENGYADGEYYYAGETVTVYSNYPASGRVFSQWKAVSGNTTFTDASRWKTTFVMPASNVTVKATYKDGPSTDNNLILDIVAGGQYITGETITFTASGAGMDNSNPNPGDYRYRPSGYQIGNVTGTWQSSPYTTSMAIKATGEYTLKVIFNKDVYDGSNWVSDGTSDAKYVTFYVITEAESVATGDETPIVLVIAIAAVSCVLFIILLIMFLKKRRK